MEGSNKIVSGSEDNTLRVWDICTGQCENVLEGHSDVRIVNMIVIILLQSSYY